MQHEPGTLLGDSESSRHLVGADAVLGVGQKPHGGQPLLQAERGVLEDRADLHRELAARMLGVALPQPARVEVVDLPASTGRAGHGVDAAPSGSRHVRDAHVRVGEVADGVEEGLRGEVRGGQCGL